jgi:hypothetical protein
MIVAPIMNFVLLEPVFSAPGFLENAAVHSVQVSVAALLGLVLGALSLGIAIAGFPVIRPLNHAGGSGWWSHRHATGRTTSG